MVCKFCEALAANGSLNWETRNTSANDNLDEYLDNCLGHSEFHVNTFDYKDTKYF